VACGKPSGKPYFQFLCKNIKKSKIAIRDQKDIYLLDLSVSTKVDYLVAGDKDLLVLPKNSLKQAKIISPKEFLDLIGFLYIPTRFS
jgi:predicted nucleic acid-binding protein